MKRILFILLICIMFISVTSCYHAPKHDIAVCITETGTRYHREHCRYLKYSKKEINLSLAIYKKYVVCKVCHPPKQVDLDKLNQGNP
jgi:hypothetical protein